MFFLTFFHIAEQNPNILINFQQTIIFYPNPEPITKDKHIIHCNTSQLSRFNFQGNVNVVVHIMVDQKFTFAIQWYLKSSHGLCSFIPNSAIRIPNSNYPVDLNFIS